MMQSIFSNSDLPLHGKNILITGATGTIGRAIAMECAKLGACIILVGRQRYQLEQVYDQISALNLAEPAMLIMDFATISDNDFYQFAERLAQEFGHLDRLIHCATQLANLTPLAHTSPAKWHLSLQVGLNAPYLLTHACLPLLYRSSAATGVLFLLHQAAEGKAYWGSYGIAKAGLRALMHTFSQEHEAQQHVFFNGFDPICVQSKLQFSIRPNGTTEALTQADMLSQILPLICHPQDYQGTLIEAQRTNAS